MPFTSRDSTNHYLRRWAERHAEAEVAQKEINALAFPSLRTGAPLRTEARAGLNTEQTLEKWEVPPLPPSHRPGFGSSTAAAFPPKGEVENPAPGLVPSNSQSIHLAVEKLSQRMGDHPDPLGAIVDSRVESLMTAIGSGDPDAAWYRGKAQALIHHHAQEAGVEVPLMRKVTAAVSPRMFWDITYQDNPKNQALGRVGQTVFPNLDVASRIVDVAKSHPADEVGDEIANRKIAGVRRKAAGDIASKMLAGELSGSDPIPTQTESEKIESFEVNLSDPTHPEHGYSSWVERHQLSAHTADVQDARAGGFHEEQLPVPREISEKTGKPSGDPFHEQLLSTPAGADIAQSTALIARTKAFHALRQQHGEGWARENAINFLAGPAQSMQWSVAREGGNVDIPEHIAEAYANRPIGGRRAS